MSHGNICFSYDLKTKILHHGYDIWYQSNKSSTQIDQHKAYFSSMSPVLDALSNGNLKWAENALTELKNSSYESTNYLNDTILSEFLTDIQNFSG